MGKLGKPSGVMIIGCRCTSNGWPLFTVKRAGAGRADVGDHWSFEWHLNDMVVNEGNPWKTVRGRCPQCKRPVHVTFPRWGYLKSHEKEAIFEDLYSIEDIPEADRPTLSAGVISAGYGVYEAYPEIVDANGEFVLDEDGEPMYQEDLAPCYCEVIEIRSSSTFLVPSSKQKEWLRSHRRVLPSRGGLRSLNVDTEAKREFVAEMRLIERRYAIDPNDLSAWQDLPDWEPTGTDEQFENWTKELQALLSKLSRQRKLTAYRRKHGCETPDRTLGRDGRIVRNVEGSGAQVPLL